MTNIDLYLSILSGLTASINAMRLYPARHPQAQSAIDRCHHSLERAFLEDSEIALLAMDDSVFFNNRPLPGAGPSSGALSAFMQRKGIDRLTFRTGLTKEELTTFLIGLSSKENTVVYAQSHIQLGKIVFDREAPLASDAVPGAYPALKLHDEAAEELRGLYHGIYGRRGFTGAEVNHFAVDFVKKFSDTARPLSYLSDIKSEDEYTYVHTVNVALLTIGFAARLGFSGKAISDIACAALMHDIGKMFVPDEILNKHGALDPAERTVMELHPVRGALYLGEMGDLPRLAMVVALEHHIRFDGTGYPRMGAQRKPHWVSQMVSIADIFDALRSRRPYRDMLEQQKVFEILRKYIGTALNPALVDRFISMVEHRQRGE